MKTARELMPAELLEVAEAARGRLGGRLVYLERQGQTLGRRPDWWNVPGRSGVAGVDPSAGRADWLELARHVGTVDPRQQRPPAKRHPWKRWQPGTLAPRKRPPGALTPSLPGKRPEDDRG
jgi:hypothetical protein